MRSLCIKLIFFVSMFAVSPAWAQMTPQQFEQVKNEYYAMKLAHGIDERCDLLSSPARHTAKYKAIELSQVLQKVGVSYADLETFDQGIEPQLTGKSCDEIAKMPHTKTAAEMVNFATGLNLYTWQQLYTKYGTQGFGREACGGGNKHDLIKKAVAHQSYLIERFKTHPNFKGVRAQTDLAVQQIRSICGNDKGFFNMTYNGSALFNLIPHVIDLYFALEAAQDTGYFEKSANSQKWMGFRGAVPQGDFDAKVPWAVLREGREKNPKSSALSPYFVDNSSVDYGLTRDKQFVVFIRTPSLADFDIDIYKAVIVKDTQSGQTWRLAPTKAYYVGYAPDYIAKHKLRPDDLVETAQFSLSNTESMKVVDAIKAGHDLEVKTERLEAGKTRLVDVEAISKTGFEAAMTYAFAPKIKL